LLWFKDKQSISKRVPNDSEQQLIGVKLSLIKEFEVSTYTDHFIVGHGGLLEPGGVFMQSHGG
jgi:hypothetical protein